MALIALMFLSTGCFQSEQPQRAVLSPHQSGPDWIWPLQQPASPSVHFVAAEDSLSGKEPYAWNGDLSETGTPVGTYSLAPDHVQTRLLHPSQIYSIGIGSGYSVRSRGVSSSAAAMFGKSFDASAVFGKSFDSLFSSLFKNGAQDADATAAGDDSRNPFRDAAKKADQSDSKTKPATDATAAASTKTDASQSAANSKPPVSAPPPTPVSAPLPPDARFVFLGDFDGSGTLKLMQASRLGDTSFLFSDAQRTFDLYINPAAVDNQRSFAIDDVNGDGIVDLLVTGRASPSGSVFLGSARGGFQLADSFETGFEPIVPVVGVSSGGMRDILAVNTRSGSITVFRAGYRYHPILAESLDFLPDYLAHLTSIQDGLDFLMAAKEGSPEVLYRDRDDGRLEDSGQRLAGSPATTLQKDFLSQGVTNALEVYQVGPYASVTLANGRGQSFNVANLKVWPRVFLAIGDLGSHGTLDVAVACLTSSTSVK